VVWANSPWHASYFSIWEQRLAIRLEGLSLDLSLLTWVNDGLMAAFFLLVGLEIKRELLVGELASPRQAALPIAAAVGGMVVPAALYLSVAGTGDAAAGWAMPMATDIAFALGVLTLLGPRIPLGLKVFLTALAVVDDMGAVVVIAVFYTGSVHLVPLAVAAAAFGVLMVFNRLRVRNLAAYVVVGFVMWGALHESGIHATLAGLLVALTIPSRTRIDAAVFSTRARDLIEEFDRAETGDRLVITSQGQQEALHALEQASEQVQAPLLRLEHGIQQLVQYAIMPLFALANAGVRLVDRGGEMVGPATVGVFFGLVVGKPVGIFLASWISVRQGWATLPAATSWRMIHGAAWLGGIGFTMSLFVATLAFGAGSNLSAAKLGILAGSTVAGVAGALILIRATRATGGAIS
jgi:NhaA family Na+:H+ antiporter